MFTKEEIMADKKRSAIITSIAVGLYIHCVVPVLIFGEVGSGVLGIVLMFVMIAAATVMLIYNNMTRLVKDDEDEEEERNLPPAIRAVNSVITAITLVVYLALSFATGAWHITWVIFIISTVTKKLVKAIFELKEVL